MAYFECVHEMKLIVDLIYEGGMTNMRYSISNTAEYGDLTRGKRVIGPEVRQAMQKILKDIQSGQFADEWINEFKTGSPHFSELRKEQANHPLEKVGAGLRSMMPWLAESPGRRIELGYYLMGESSRPRTMPIAKRLAVDLSAAALTC